MKHPSVRSNELHRRLIARQSTEELKRKAYKAGYQTQEEIDYALRWADEVLVYMELGSDAMMARLRLG